MTKVLITDGMAENGLELLRNDGGFELEVRKSTTPEELISMIDTYEAIVIRSATTLTAELLEKAKNMKLIVRAGAGVDNIDVEKATSLKIPVMNTASANSLAAAEQTIALMFAVARFLPQSYASLQSEKWDRGSFKGVELTGKTLGLIGLGNIGKLVAEKAIGLGMQVIAFDPQIQSLSQLPSLSRQEEAMTVVTDWNAVIAKADFLSLHIPKTPQTAHMINTDVIGKMKKGAYLIQCARGGVVEESAVFQAVESGHLAGAAFDVFEREPPEFSNPILKHPRIVCVPHLGASTQEAQARVASTAASQMIGFFKNNDRNGVINQL